MCGLFGPCETDRLGWQYVKAFIDEINDELKSSLSCSTILSDVGCKLSEAINGYKGA